MKDINKSINALRQTHFSKPVLFSRVCYESPHSPELKRGRISESEAGKIHRFNSLTSLCIIALATTVATLCSHNKTVVLMLKTCVGLLFFLD